MASWVSPDLLNYLILLSLYIATWLPSIRGGYVSDDIEGVAKFSDRLEPEVVDPKTLQVTRPERLVTTYEVTHGNTKVQLGHRAFNRYIEFPGCIIRWLRLNLGAKFQKIGTNKQGHAVYGYVQSPAKHHLINIIIHGLNVGLAYAFLSNVFGPQLALFTLLLFIPHPAASQAVAWCSGIGYLISLFGSLVTLNLSLFLTDLHLLIPATAATTLLSVSGMMAGVGTGFLLLFLGHKYTAGAALIVATLSLYKQGRSLVAFRTAEFKKQQMGKSTYLTWRKPILMVKTFYYYIKLILWPKRLGLFHTWGYHFEETLERVDGMFWRGLLTLVLLGWAFLAGPMPIQFGLLWMFVYIAIFLNFITAQQFVADRYAFIPSLGVCLVLAYFLQPYPIIIAFLTGLLVMRTWVHLPTFDNEVKFYQSNIWNFPNSEVAYGNLGVIYANNGYKGAAADTWLMSSQINPLYDVPLYNLYAYCKSERNLRGAREMLLRCLNAKVVHFPDMWKRELEELEKHMAIQARIDEFNAAMNKAVSENRFEDVHKIRAEFDAFAKTLNPPPQKNVK